MKLEISLKNKKMTILLKDGNKVVDESLWSDENNLSEKLLVEIDGLLARNGAKKKETAIKIKTDDMSGFTTERIARAVANAWNHAISKQ